MDAKAIDGKALAYVLVQPEGSSADAGFPLVVLLHGFGASMHDLASLAPTIDAAGYVYAFPNAPYRADLGGATGFSWALGRRGVEAPPTEGPSVEEMLDAFMADVIAETGVSKGKIVLAGFSQGGGLTLRYGLPRPDVFAGLAVLSGAFRDADEMRDRLPPQRSQPIFVGHGRQQDPLISLDRSHETKAFLEAEGYAPLYREYDMAHEISAAEIADLVPWLHAALPPATR